MPHVPVPASLASRLLLTHCRGLGICPPQHSEQLVGVEVASLSAGTLFLYRSSWRRSAFPRGSPKTCPPSDFDCIETSLCLDSIEHKQSWATGGDETKNVSISLCFFFLFVSSSSLLPWYCSSSPKFQLSESSVSPPINPSISLSPSQSPIAPHFHSIKRYSCS